MKVAIRKLDVSCINRNGIGFSTASLGLVQISPLQAAVLGGQIDLVAELLLLGADPDAAMRGSQCWKSARSGILQLLVGDVNQGGASRPILAAVLSDSQEVEAKIRMLLAQPRLSLAVMDDWIVPEQHAREHGHDIAAELIKDEVLICCGGFKFASVTVTFELSRGWTTISAPEYIQHEMGVYVPVPLLCW